MDFQTCLLVNVPLSALNIVMNAFFIFCMIWHLQDEKIKQPLKLLLVTLICCTITFLTSVIVQFFMETDNMQAILTSNVIFIFTLFTSMTSSVWLNFFYYTQIVPAKRALCGWIKKNIKPIIYCIWFVEKVLIMFNIGTLLIYRVTAGNLVSDMMSLNSTINYDMILLKMPPLLTDVCVATICIIKAHFIFCLFIMVMSSGSTVIYLYKHMRRMATNCQARSCPQFGSQVRVTITGLLQGVLYLFCAVWTLYNYFSEDIFSGPFSGYTYEHFTVISLYMTGTSFNLGAGQAVFRQRAAVILLRTLQRCKVPKVQQCEQGA